MPRAIVFTGTDRGAAEQFEGWAKPSDLLRIMLDQDERYRRVYERAVAARRQWERVQPPAPGVTIAPADSP
jgi:hypothetical protein